MASLKDLFTNPVSKIVNEKKVLETGYFENIDEVFELTKTNNRHQSTIDFSDPANFAKFGSAVKYYNDAINQINQTYPHNKSGLEKQTWENNLSDLEYYIYKNEYPRTTGYFYSSGSAYININNNVPTAETLKDTFENNPKSVYGSNLYLDSTKGITIEFWMNSESANGILLRLSSSASELMLTASSSVLKIGASPLTTVTPNSWNHFAFAISSSNVDTYINGIYSNSSTIASQIVGNILIGKVVESYKTKIDEFRIWNVARTPKQIGRFWKTHVNGNSATDKTLSVYYKFNEGTALNDSLNQFVEDYSGRDNYGNIVNYNSNCRSTDSGIDLSGLSADLEEKDLILYSLDNSQALKDYLSEKLDLATEFDSSNYQRLYYTLPSWMIEEEQKDDTKHMENFMQIISVYFDELLNKSSEISKYKHIKYTGDDEEIVPFYNKILSSTGFDVSDILSNADIVEKLLNKTDTNVLDEDITRVKNIIYQNIYNNLTYILKSKGTEKSVKNFLRAYGINDNLVKLNVYGDNVEYKLTDTFNATSVNKKTIYLTGSQTIVQTDTADVNDVETLPALDLPVTLEVLSYFPSTQKQQDTTISLFGFDKLIGAQTIKAFFIKDSQDKKAGKFHLTSSVDNINLTSSTIYDVYDNSKWHLSIRLTSDTAYFYGTNTVADQAVNTFNLSASITSSFLNNTKEIYVGSDGTYSADYKVASVRYWNDFLTNDELFYHSKDIENYGRTHFSQYSDLSGNNTHKDIERLLLNWTFDTVTGSNSSGQFFVEDEKWYYNDNVSSYLQDARNLKYPGLGKYFSTSSNAFIDKTPLQTMKQSLPETLNSSDMINILSEDDAAFYGTGKKPEQYYLAFENSMYQQVSDEMLKFAASIVDFNNLIGEPKYKFTQEYQTLNELKQLFFKNIGNVPSLEKYINLYKWLDSSLGMMLEQLRPATARGTIGLKPVIENHVFSRNKVQHTLPYFKEKIIDLSTHIANPNDRKGVRASGMKINNPAPHSKTAVNSIEGNGIDVVSIENIRNTNYFNNYEIVQIMKDTENTHQNKSIFQAKFSEQIKDLDAFNVSQSAKLIDNSISSSTGIDYNNSFVGYNIPGRDINYAKSASTAIGVFDYQSIPSGSVLENRYNNNLLGYTEPPVEWTLPSYSKLKVSTALEPIEIYSPYNSLRDSIANVDLWNFLNKTQGENLFAIDTSSGSTLYYGAEALDKRDSVFFDTIYQIPNIDIHENYHRDIVFPLKSNMGLNIIRNKPDYEEIAGTGSNGYDRNTAEIRSFWNSDPDERLRKKPLLTNETGSYNCFNIATYSGDDSSILKSQTKLNIFSSSFYNISMSCLIDTDHTYYKSLFELDSKTKSKIYINDDIFNINFNSSGSFPNNKNIYGDLTPFSDTHLIGFVLKNNMIYDDEDFGLINNLPIESKPQFIYNNYFGMTTTNIQKLTSPDRYTITASLNLNNSYQNGVDPSINPSYNSYKEFTNNIRPKSQYYSILPEFITSNNRSFLTSSIIESDGKSLIGFNDSIRNIAKTNYQINFSNLLKNTDNKIKLTLNGVKKLLPYSGFYPSSRTMQIASEFSKSYSLGTLSGTSGSTPAQKIQTLIQPLFSPGILFNSIKAGIAVDYPIYVSSSDVSYSDFYSYDNYNDEKSSIKKYSNRLPFESLLEPERLLGLSNANNTWLYYLDPTRYSNMFSSSYGDNRFYPAIDLVSGNKIINKLYKQSINNFLAEVPNFFLESKLLTYFVSKPETEWQKADDNKVYKMRIKLEQSKNFSMFSTGSGNVIAVESLFGPPSYIYYGAVEHSSVYSSDSYLPFTPSYFKRWRQNFVSNPDFNQQNFIELSYNGDGTNPSISEIKSGSGTRSIRITKYWTSTGNTDSATPEPITNTAYYHHMNVDSSLNLFGKIKSKIVTTDSVTGQDLTTEENPDSPSRWIIQTKFETPLINYKETPEPAVTIFSGNFNTDIYVYSGSTTLTNNTASINVKLSSINGIWNKMGTIPEDNSSIQLSLTDEGITFNDQTGSLLELCGFEKQTKSIGRIADKKVISEAVLMLPYKIMSKPSRSIVQDSKNNLVKIDKSNKIMKDYLGIKIPRQTINDLLKVSDYTKIKPRFVRNPKDETIREIKKILETNKTIDKNNSIVQLMINMVNYNVPTYLNWLYDTRIEPFVMYIGEFTHELSQQDLANIWQGTLPEIGLTPEEQTISLDYPIKDGELLNKDMVEYIKNNDFKAEIFKIKKRANTDYKRDTTLDESDEFLIEPMPWYTFNWPYDHFSLVELINIESESGFKKE